MKFETSPLIQARPRWRSISSRAELISSETGSTAAGFMSRSVSMIRCAMTRHCGQRNPFVHDNDRGGFALKRRECAFSGDLNAAAPVARKYYNHMKNQ